MIFDAAGLETVVAMVIGVSVLAAEVAMLNSLAKKTMAAGVGRSRSQIVPRLSEPLSISSFRPAKLDLLVQ